MKAIEKKKKKFWHNINKVVASRKVPSFLPSLVRLFEGSRQHSDGKGGPLWLAGYWKCRRKEKMDMNMNMRK